MRAEYAIACCNATGMIQHSQLLVHKSFNPHNCYKSCLSLPSETTRCAFDRGDGRWKLITALQDWKWSCPCLCQTGCQRQVMKVFWAYSVCTLNPQVFRRNNPIYTYTQGCSHAGRRRSVVASTRLDRPALTKNFKKPTSTNFLFFLFFKAFFW